MIKAYHSRLTSSDNEVRRKAAHAWSRWEMATSRLHSDPDMLSKADSDEFADVFARIEAHYFVNGGHSCLRFPSLTMQASSARVSCSRRRRSTRCGARHKSTKLTWRDPPHPECVSTGAATLTTSATIVQGRYGALCMPTAPLIMTDCVCPAISAWDLHRAWPEAKFISALAVHHAACCRRPAWTRLAGPMVRRPAS